VVPSDHNLSIGVNYTSLGPAHRVVPESDVVLAVGTRFLIAGLELTDAQRIIQIDADPTEIGKNHPVEVGIEADAREALRALLRELRSITAPGESRSQEIEGYKQAFEDEMRRLAPQQLSMIDAIRSALDDDAVVVSGVTNVGYWSNLALPVAQPRTFVTSSYFGTLGYAFPTALGAKAGNPDRQVVALCGDGGFMFNVQELSTAAKHGLNVVAVVFNNGAYGASLWDQTHRYGERYIGTSLSNPDFGKLAEAFGVVGMKTDADGLGVSLGEALAASAPVLLEVVVPTMMPPFQIVG